MPILSSVHVAHLQTRLSWIYETIGEMEHRGVEEYEINGRRLVYSDLREEADWIEEKLLDATRTNERAVNLARLKRR